MPDVCVNCYRLPQALCTACGRRRPCNFADGRNPICKTCAPRAASACARCGLDRPPAARWPEGPVCDTCYTSALRRRGACTACGQQRRLIAPPGPDAIMCADCAGLPLTHLCATVRRRGQAVRERPVRPLQPARPGLGRCCPGPRPGRSAGLTAGHRGHHRGPEPLLGPELAADRRRRGHPRRGRGRPHRTHSPGAGRSPATSAPPTTCGTCWSPAERCPPGTRPWPASSDGAARCSTAIDEPADRRLVQAYADLAGPAAPAPQVRRPAPARAPSPAAPGTRSSPWSPSWPGSASTTSPWPPAARATSETWLATGPAAYDVRDFLAWAADRKHCPALHDPRPAAHGPAPRPTPTSAGN